MLQVLASTEQGAVLVCAGGIISADMAERQRPCEG